jgi:hypothetical protein
MSALSDTLDSTSVEARIEEAYNYYYYRSASRCEPSYIQAGVPPRLVEDYVRSRRQGLRMRLVPSAAHRR